MQSAPLPANETARLEALQRLEILDTDTEFLYDDVTELASQICDTPICLVSLVDSDRQWFKSRHGLDAAQTPRDFAFCAHAILGDELFEVEDSRKDARFHDNPLVTDTPNVVFYAGFPLDLGDGLKVGTLCVIDQKPKRLTDKQRSAMRCLSNQVVAHLRLRRANAELQRALNAKSTFLASMSHEIRTPLNGILGITNILMESIQDAEAREHLQTVRNCGDMLLRVLNDILDFSKIESGKLSYEMHPFRLGEVMRNVREVLQPLASQKGLTLRVDPGFHSEWIISDSTRLSQILMNLIGNAIKFTAAGEVSLIAAKRPLADGRNEFSFTVRDSGIGIAKEDQAKLFSSFTQVDSATTRKFGGTGLGLAIVKGLVHGMGGNLGIESEPGRGSTFRFTLPFAAGTPPAAHADGKDPRGSASGTARERPLSILIAEDNRVNQIVAMKMASSLGYAPDLASDGEEAVRMAAAGNYDLILMDCQMPLMDGFEAAERIRADFPPEKRPAIYALTAAVMEAERDRCLAAGMIKVLQKPLSLETLRKALHECPMRAA